MFGYLRPLTAELRVKEYAYYRAVYCGVCKSMEKNVSPLLSMTLRYIPLFRGQVRKTQQAQKALGLYKEDSIPDSIRGGIRIFSVMVSWALENGVITADSMTARGYGTKRRSHFSVFRFRREDALLLGTSLVLAAFVFLASDEASYITGVVLSVDGMARS